VLRATLTQPVRKIDITPVQNEKSPVPKWNNAFFLYIRSACQNEK